MSNIIEIKWGTSRGYSTYGYTTCSLKYNGEKMAYCNGGGYDMRGSVIGELITKLFHKEIMQNKAEFEKQNLYGLTYTDKNSFYIDGACGLSSMERILKALGYELKTIKDSRTIDIYLLEKISI